MNYTNEKTIQRENKLHLFEYLICSAIEKRWTQFYNHTHLSCSEFIESIQFILQSNFFQFNEQFYNQKFGSAMGNPISPILADIVMQDLETYALSKLCFDSIFYFRDVDDILLCVPKNLINYTRDIFNIFDKHLQFTTEKSMDNKISFLDIEIIVKNHKIITNWYRKPTFSCRFLNYNSHHPHKNKIAIIYSLVDRAIKLAHTLFHNVNLNLIKQFLILNDYPIELINKYI